MVQEPPPKVLVRGGREDPHSGVFACCGVLSSRVRGFGRVLGWFRGS